jgi:hypothetical protein
LALEKRVSSEKRPRRPAPEADVEVGDLGALGGQVGHRAVGGRELAHASRRFLGGRAEGAEP